MPKSELAWKDYAGEEKIDCVIVGTSRGMAGLDPKELDLQVEASSFNLCTPCQLFDESYLAVRTAYEDNQITMVILCLSYAQVMRSSNPNPGSAFMHQRSQVVSLSQQLYDITYLLFDGGSISKPNSLNMVFPWVSNKVSKSLAP